MPRPHAALLAALAVTWFIASNHAQILYSPTYCQRWIMYEETHSSGATAYTDASTFAECFYYCNTTSTDCEAFDYTYTNATGVQSNCWTYTSAKMPPKIGHLADSDQLRKSNMPCPAAEYFENAGCLWYVYWNHRGISAAAFQSTTKTLYSDCRDTCLGESTCEAYDFNMTSGGCNLFNYTYAYEIAPAWNFGGTNDYDETHFWIKGECMERDPNEYGFFLHATQKKGGTGTSSTMTFTDCWDSCFAGLLCEGFDYDTANGICIILDASTVNTTTDTPGYLHHTLIETESAAGMTLTAPSVLDPPTPLSDVECVTIVETRNTRGIRMAMSADGSAGVEDCVAACRADTTNCVSGSGYTGIIEFDADERPFKGIRCYLYKSNSVTLSSSPAKRHRYTIETTGTCPGSDSTTTAEGATWDVYDSMSGIYLTGITVSTATTVTECMQACIVTHGYDCWSIDWVTSTTTCKLYPYSLTYWMRSAPTSETVSHYVISALSVTRPGT